MKFIITNKPEQCIQVLKIWDVTTIGNPVGTIKHYDLIAAKDEESVRELLSWYYGHSWTHKIGLSNQLKHPFVVGSSKRYINISNEDLLKTAKTLGVKKVRLGMWDHGCAHWKYTLDRSL